MTVFQRTGNWFLPRKNRPYPAPLRTAIERLPRLQELRRRFVFEYSESLTLMIRHPRTFGRLGAARSAAFMRWQLKDPELREKVWPDYTFGCKRILFSSQFLPALQRPNVELVTEPDRGDRARGRAHRRRRACTSSTASSGRPASARTTSCSRWRSPAATGARWKRSGARRARPPRHLRARLPEHVRPLRPQHEHLGRLDHLLPGDAGRLRAPGAAAAARARRRRDRGAPRGRGGQRPRGAGPLRGHRLDAVRLVVPRRARAHRRQLARLHARVPAPHRACSTRREFSFAPLPEPAGCAGAVPAMERDARAATTT